LIDRIDPRDSN
jgi:hypothetical protein